MSCLPIFIGDRVSTSLKLISPIPPSVNHYLAYRAIIRNGKPLAMSYETPESSRYRKAFSAYVVDEVKRQGWDITPNKSRHFYVDTWFYFPRVDLDANNYFKVMLDAITDTKLVWLDDNVVCERVQAIRYDSSNPRVEIVIHPVGYIGIFDNLPQYEAFVSNCIGCTRYKRNCSLLSGAISGKIQDDIVDEVCLKYKGKNNVDRRREAETR